ncbi:MAG: radical protein, partial [Reyranella sp.]|nr:radical protein [Reyranella sp.]
VSAVATMLLHDGRPLDSPEHARRVIRVLRFSLEGEIGDPAVLQELLLLVLGAKLFDETSGGKPKFTATDGEAASPARLQLLLDRTVAWLAHTTRESWERKSLPESSIGDVFRMLQDYSLLATAAHADGPAILRGLFDEVAGPTGALLPESQFARPQSAQRLLDAAAFKSRKPEFQALAVAFCKAFGRLDILKKRNLEYMRGNHKRGDLGLTNYPKLIHVELATACNLRCRFCSITRPGRERDRTFIKFEVLERLRPMLPFVSDCKLHGGGEPFLHPQIEQVLEVFRDEGVRLNTVTNGHFVNDRIGKLIGETFTTLTVSVDGSDRETYEYIRLRASWSKLLRGLDMINKYRNPNFKLIIGVVMVKSNIHQLPDLVRFAKEHGGQELQAAWQVPFADLPWTHEQRLTEDPERTNRFMAETRAVGRELGISVRIPNDLPLHKTPEEKVVRLDHADTYWDLHGTNRVEGHCRLMYDRCMILVDGRVKPCGQSRTVHELGSVLNRSFEECWNGDGYQRLRKTFNSGTLPRTCQSCNFIRSNQTGTARLVY